MTHTVRNVVVAVAVLSALVAAFLAYHGSDPKISGGVVV